MIRGVILDIDGVLVRGSQLLPGALEAVSALQRAGLQLAFCTNENFRTAGDVAAKLAQMGLPVRPENLVTGGVVAADVVARGYPGQRILALGGPGLLEPMRQRGVDLISLAEAATAEVVVMGRDPEFNYARLQAVCQAIWNGARFLATNYDAKLPVENGFVAGTGALVKAVEFATGVEPLILAKPSRWPVTTCLRNLDLTPDAVVVVGDNYRQDIGMGKLAGTKTVLVLSGATRKGDLPIIPAELRPDAVLDGVGLLPEWLGLPVA